MSATTLGQRSRGNTRKHGKGTPKARETRPKKNAATTAPVVRDSAGRWMSSGNPEGRPTVALEIREKAREYEPEAIERLVYWMRSGDAQNSIAAAKTLLDRGYGKSVQLLGSPNGAPLVNINMGQPITDPAEAARVYAELMHNPSADLSAVTFASPPPSAVVAESPAKEAAPIVAEVGKRALELPDRLAERIAPVKDDTAATWARLAE
jgi:hypothetical protein